MCAPPLPKRPPATRADSLRRSSYINNQDDSSAYGSNSAQGGVGVGATADPTQYDSDRYNNQSSSGFGQQGGKCGPTSAPLTPDQLTPHDHSSTTSGYGGQDSSPTVGGNNDAKAYGASDNSTSAYGQGQAVGGDGAYGAGGAQQSSFGTQGSEFVRLISATA